MSTKVRPSLGLHLINFAAEGHTGGWDHLFALARAADKAGVDRVMVSDHVVFGEQLEEYANPAVGGRDGGQQPTGPDGHWLDPLTTLAMVAAQTKNVRVATQILLAGIRRPVTLAKSTSTLDVLSGGRLDLGVGVGWQKAEYDAAGLPFETRGNLFDNALEALSAFWRGGSISLSQPGLTFDKIHQGPTPLQEGGVPLWISGTVRDSTARRLAKYGERWIAWGKDEDMELSVPRMKDAIAKAGGKPDALQASAPLPAVYTADRGIDVAATMDKVPARLKAGQTDFSFAFIQPGDEAFKTEKLAEIVKAFDQVTGRAKS